MNGAPQILVVARYRDADDAARILQCLSRQTYRDTRIVFVLRTEKEVAALAGGALEMCSESGLIPTSANPARTPSFFGRKKAICGKRPSRNCS